MRVPDVEQPVKRCSPPSHVREASLPKPEETRSFGCHLDVNLLESTQICAKKYIRVWNHIPFKVQARGYRLASLRRHPDLKQWLLGGGGPFWETQTEGQRTLPAWNSSAQSGSWAAARARWPSATGCNQLTLPPASACALSWKGTKPLSQVHFKVGFFAGPKISRKVGEPSCKLLRRCSS